MMKIKSSDVTFVHLYNGKCCALFLVRLFFFATPFYLQWLVGLHFFSVILQFYLLRNLQIALEVFIGFLWD